MSQHPKDGAETGDAGLREQFDFVIVDTPPLLAVTDRAVVVSRMDAVFLVVRLAKNGRPAAESLGAADLHLIPLRRGLAGCIVPSKLYGILAAGRPYLAAMDADGEVALVTREYGTGVLIDPDDTDRLVEALLWCAAHRDELAAMGRRGRRLAEDLFDRRRSVGRFGDVLGELAPPVWRGPHAVGADGTTGTTRRGKLVGSKNDGNR